MEAASSRTAAYAAAVLGKNMFSMVNEDLLHKQASRAQQLSMRQKELREGSCICRASGLGHEGVVSSSQHAMYRMNACNNRILSASCRPVDVAQGQQLSPEAVCRMHHTQAAAVGHKRILSKLHQPVNVYSYEVMLLSTH